MVSAILLKFITFFTIIGVILSLVPFPGGASSLGFNLLQSSIESNPFKGTVEVFASTQYLWGAYHITAPTLTPDHCPNTLLGNLAYTPSHEPESSGHLLKSGPNTFTPYYSGLPDSHTWQSGAWNFTGMLHIWRWNSTPVAVTFGMSAIKYNSACVWQQYISQVNVTFTLPAGSANEITDVLVFFSMPTTTVSMGAADWLVFAFTAYAPTQMEIFLVDGPMARYVDPPANHRIIITNSGITNTSFSPSYYRDPIYETHFTVTPEGCGSDVWCKLVAVGSGLLFVLSAIIWVIMLIFTFIAVLFVFGIIIGGPAWLSLLSVVIMLPYWAVLVQTLAEYVRGVRM